MWSPVKPEGFVVALTSRETSDDLIKAYKTLLSAIIDKRPSGTRQRLADALGKHRSFITQITGVTYPTPVPERHLAAIFSICHFSAEEQRVFLKAYDFAHPERAGRGNDLPRLRQMSLMVRDLGDEEKNRKFDDAITEFAQKIGAFIGQSKE
jgi:hypothetical protein